MQNLSQKRRVKSLKVVHKVSTGNRIVLATRVGKYLVGCHEISHCVADGNYVHVVLKGGTKIFMAKTLKFIENLLNGPDFVRTHQSYLVNISQVELVTNRDVRLKCGTRIPVARSKRGILQQLMV